MAVCECQFLVSISFEVPTFLLYNEWAFFNSPAHGVSNGIRAYKCQGVAEQDKSWRVIREVLADIFEGLVDRAVFVLSDLLGVFIDKVWGSWLVFEVHACADEFPPISA